MAMHLNGQPHKLRMKIQIKEKMQEFLHFFVKYVKKIDLLSKNT